MVTVAALVATPAATSAQVAATMVACKDGSSAKKGKGACSDHGGVAADSAKIAAKTTAKAAKDAKAKAKATAKVTATAAKVAAAGGGPGKVWVNTKTGVFQHEGDDAYGKTKEGKYMTEAEALKAGYRARKSSSDATKKP